jgi:NADH-quinone oxidoreductase subunit C
VTGRAELTAELATRLGGTPARDQAADLPTVDVESSAWVAALTAARDAGFSYFDWLTAVDERDGGIRVVAHVYDPMHRSRLLLRTLLTPDAPQLDTATAVFPGADWHERETAEMFGIVFPGHPDPRPLLLADTFTGHPLRKDFVLAARAEKPWPGETEPGAGAGRRRRAVPPGVPGPGEWPQKPAQDPGS